MAKKQKPSKRWIPSDQRSAFGRAKIGERVEKGKIVGAWGGYVAKIREIYDVAEKLEPEQCPQAIDAVQGCGDPNCSICMPGRRGANWGNASDRYRDRASMFSALDMSRVVQEAILFGSGGFPGLVTPGSKKESLEDAIKRKASDRLARLQRDEEAARAKVEKYLLTTKVDMNWSDVVGNEDAHRAMIEAVEFPIKHKELFAFYGKKPTKGILLSGPPGCGKTMIARAAASVVGKLHGKDVAFLNIKATELQQPYVGQTEQIIRDLFAYARAYKALHGHQLILFIDEADAILPRRSGGMRRVANWEESNVATFLAEMDGLEESGAVVILATNRPEAIDQALLRDGRIDRKVIVQRPNQMAASIIFERALHSAPIAVNPVQTHQDPIPIEVSHLVKREYLTGLAMNELFSPLRHIMRVKTENGVDFLNLADCVSGAMIVGLVERAKANAFHRDIETGIRTGILEQDIMAAIETVMKEQIANPDFYALTELAQRLKAPVLELDRVQQPELKYTGTLQ